MRRSLFLAIGLLLASTPAFSQAAAPATDSQTLKDLLQEVRQLRKDLQASITISQKAQIVLYQMQAQQTAVARAQQRLDDARGTLAQLQVDEKHIKDETKMLEESTEKSQNAIERKDAEDALPRLKARAEELAGMEQQAQTKEAVAEGQLQTEQAKLDALQSELTQLERMMESLARPAESGKQ